MDSDLQFRHQNRYQFGGDDNSSNQPFNQQQPQQQPAVSGLTRYRSAPSSYFATLLDSTVNDEFLNQRTGSPDMDRMLARFMDSGGADDSNTHNSSVANEAPPQTQFLESVKHEADIFHHQSQHQQSSNYSSDGQIYQNQSQQQPPSNCNEAAPNSRMDNSYSVVGSMAMDTSRLPPPTKMSGGGGTSNLIRQSSSPAGLFSSYINIEHGYGGLRGIESLRSVNVTNPEASLPSPSSLKRKFDYSSGAPPPPSSRKMASISESRSKSMDMSGAFEDIGKEGGYIDGFPMGAWDDSSMLSDSYVKTLDQNDERKALSGINSSQSSQNQRAESGNRPPAPLAHQMSLPTSSEELEKLLQFQDSVPLNVRAKRGCATHPRSIAERVRRNRISERMRKLQELVPNMDKQTNTSDMLDFAVDYIKELQKELKTLSDNRARCTCPK